MEKKWISTAMIVMMIGMGTLSSGCALFLLGAGGAGGYAISKDEIEGMLDQPYDKVWKASETVLRQEGLVTLSLKDKGEIQAEVEKSKIEVSIDQLTPKTVRLRVKGRRLKNLFPDIKKAQNTFNQIMRQLD
ncbi:MAG TPA: DUF3568 family protein [bacterium]|nr:DUF3568 family protein [bacterium]